MKRLKILLKNLLKAVFLFVCGGGIYTLIEVLWRGRTHISMFIVGGLCFYLIGLFNEFTSWEDSLFKQMLGGAVLITVFELLSGFYLNCYLCLNIWDYSDLPFNFMGQICPLFFIAWFFLSLIAIVIDDLIRWKLFKEPKPIYKFI